ncbi:MAG: hypothetical protein GWP61_18630 [Chloroflexi bacterium]|jgi:hypothetical protein|nr:hypothetical protein [Chloroflexota bacterium]
MSSNVSLSQQAIGHFDIRSYAAREFWRAYRKGWWSKIVSRLNGRNNELNSLSQANQDAISKSGSYAGIQTVAIGLIRGSEGRNEDFDIDFHPLKKHNRSRWIGILIARLQGVPLPPVELIQIGQEYFVRDGHHRISVASSLGQAQIDAHITVFAA